MEETIIQVLGTIAVSLSASLIGLWTFRRQEKRLQNTDDTNRAAALNDMALELLEPYKRELAEVRRIQAIHEAQIMNLISERDALKDWAEKLCCQVRDAGLVPEKYIEPKTRPINYGREDGIS